ncbi:MAG: hypothetical protein ABW198_09795 [Pseudorhodoplanes sp.]
MTRRLIFAFASAVVFAAAATASVRHSLAPSTAIMDSGHRVSNNKPYFLKGRMVDSCFDHSPECVLLAW